VRITLVAAVLAFGLAAPVSAGVTPSGVTGQVVARQGGLGCFRAPCVRWMPGVMVTFTRGVRTVRARSDRSGRFRFALARGMWTAQAPGLMVLGMGPFVVRVREGRFLPVTFLLRGPAAELR
jgi:hypothetical protein